MIRARSVILLLAVCLSAGLGAAVDRAPAWAQAPTAVTVSTPAGDVTVLADRMEQVGPDNLLIATGNVEVTKGSARLVADRVEINRATGDTVAEGRPIFYDGDTQLEGDRIEYNFRTGTGIVHHARSRTPPFYRINGERLERLDESRYQIRRGVFTTCEDDPPAWSFRFGSGFADLEEWIYGTEASLWVKNFPLIPFIPFFAAAIRRERQTGFLFPKFSTSTRKGFSYEQPFFWAISDSQDATVSFDVFQKLGVGGSAEYRYFLSSTNHGTASGFFIKETREQLHGQGHDDNRGWFRFQHDWLVTPSLSLKADINHVTDDFVFREFGDPLAERASQRVESNIFVTKSWPAWNFVGNLFWYQDLTTQRATELNRLPDLKLQGVRQPIPGMPGFLYDVESSFVNFVREVGSEGTRFDLHPKVTRPISVFGFFTVAPFAGVRLTTYDKTVTGRQLNFDQSVLVEQTVDDPRFRQLLELGSDFEARATRLYELGGRWGIDAVLHSIEPRLNYTWIDGADLAHLPQWTSGIDDIKHTSSVNFTLTNRLRARTVAPEGTEPVRWDLARFTLGTSYDLLTSDFGNATAELIVDPNRIWTFRGDVGVGRNGIETATTDVSVRLPTPAGALISPLAASLGTRYNKPGDVNFLQGNLVAELAPWVVGRLTTNWDIRHHTFVENRYALDLKWQCWALTVEFVSRVRDVVLAKADEEFRFSLNLLGVGTPLSTSVGLSSLAGAMGGKIR